MRDAMRETMRKRENARRKKCTAFVAVMLWIILSISGCASVKETVRTKDFVGAQQENQGAQDAQEEAEGTDNENETADAPIRLEDCVQEAYHITRTLDIDQYYSIELDYHIPEILLDGNGAETLNAQILADYEEEIWSGTNQAYDYFPEWSKISYEAVLYGDYLSIIMLGEAEDNCYCEYTTYNLNVATGEVATTQELASCAGIEASDLSQLLRRAAVYEVDQMILETMTSTFFQEEEDTQYLQKVFQENLNARLCTIEEENLSLEKIPFCLSEDGILQAAVPIHTLAGAGIDHRLLTINSQTAYEDISISLEDAVYLTYTGGEMCVRIEENEWSRAAFANSHIEFGKEYPVAGVYKDYIQGELLGIQSGEYVLPVFVADDHTVAYLDIYECAKGGSFYLTEMAYVPMPVEAITEENADAISEALSHYIFERYAGFSQKALDLWEGESCNLEGTIELEDGSTVLYSRNLAFDENDPDLLCFQDYNDSGSPAGYVIYEGHCTYIGMDEKGIILSYYLENAQYALVKQGMFRIARNIDWDDEIYDYRIYMNYQEISGDELFGGDGQPIELGLAFG